METRSRGGLLAGTRAAIQPLLPLYVTWYQTGSVPCLAVAVSLDPWGIVATWVPVVLGRSRSLTPMGLNTHRPSSRGPLADGDNRTGEGLTTAAVGGC
jgi:hypothetical protein